MKATDTEAPFVHRDSRLKTTLGTLGIVAAMAAAGALAWGTTRQEVTRHDSEIRSLQADYRAQREVLIRIDERTAEIKRQMDRPGR